MEKWNKLRDVIAELRDMQERAWIPILALVEDYFSITDETAILKFHDRARVQCDIAHDYIFRVGELASEAYGILAG
ncbi:hypothetical protein MUB23_00355 [Cuneatibacter sp. NSJ-177]|uniref:hypothetical protein n=1 Tax=Cuneatibacter sp. NSJ-177 TaxID=2931401 RepID=UPI001FCFA95B|nr:hypothetical protein [Cuneatibacter sp. NSJ-177]MCJ7833843.1 hypothetical protein [Cuneatibacter sp. NSJ-177]